MPFPRPKLTVLRQQAMQDITASDLPNADGFLRRAALRVIAWVQAGLAHLHYGYLDWIAKQAVPYTATDEFLEAWAALAPTPVIRKAPTPAKCPVVTFAAIAGSLIPSGSIVYRTDNTQYTVDADARSTGSSITLSITAVLPGSAGDADQGTPLTLATAAEGVTSNSGVAGQPITGGSDLETDSSLRSRMLESYAAPPAGGDADDYVTWALEVSGVTRAWTAPNAMGGGTVSVYFMMDAANAQWNGFPQGTSGVAAQESRDVAATGDELAVANWIYPLRPVTALVYAVAPSPLPQPFTISGLSTTSASQRAQVSAALTALFLQKGNPLGAGGIEQSDVDAAISAVPGLPTFAVTFPSAWPIVPPFGSLFTLGSVTYS
jgi:uncharacterized phage protein gp47/JayE